MLVKRDAKEYLPVLEKVSRKTLAYGKKTLMTEFYLEAGATLPLHDHPHEQTGYLLSGRMELRVGQETWRIEAGDSWCIPGGVAHSARAFTDSVAVEVFAPVREDYLDGT